MEKGTVRGLKYLSSDHVEIDLEALTLGRFAIQMEFRRFCGVMETIARTLDHPQTAEIPPPQIMCLDKLLAQLAQLQENSPEEILAVWYKTTLNSVALCLNKLNGRRDYFFFAPLDATMLDSFFSFIEEVDQYKRMREIQALDIN